MLEPGTYYAFRESEDEIDYVISINDKRTCIQMQEIVSGQIYDFQHALKCRDDVTHVYLQQPSFTDDFYLLFCCLPIFPIKNMQLYIRKQGINFSMELDDCNEDAVTLFKLRRAL